MTVVCVSFTVINVLFVNVFKDKPTQEKNFMSYHLDKLPLIVHVFHIVEHEQREQEKENDE